MDCVPTPKINEPDMDAAPPVCTAASNHPATWLISPSFNPRVVNAGVPNRIPLVTRGGRGSFGTPL